MSKGDVGRLMSENKDEIKAGEYIRTTEGCIVKIKNDEHLDFLKFSNAVIGNIKDHKDNIIDLIEAGDIVEIQNKLDGCKTIFSLNKDIIGIYKEQIENGSIKLTSILTHEMYNQNCYKVEDKE